MPGNHPKEKIQ